MSGQRINANGTMLPQSILRLDSFRSAIYWQEAQAQALHMLQQIIGFSI